MLIAAPIICRAGVPSCRRSVRPTSDRQASYFCGQVYNTLRRRAQCCASSARRQRTLHGPLGVLLDSETSFVDSDSDSHSQTPQNSNY